MKDFPFTVYIPNAITVAFCLNLPSYFLPSIYSICFFCFFILFVFFWFNRLFLISLSCISWSCLFLIFSCSSRDQSMYFKIVHMYHKGVYIYFVLCTFACSLIVQFELRTWWILSWFSAPSVRPLKLCLAFLPLSWHFLITVSVSCLSYSLGFS